MQSDRVGHRKPPQRSNPDKCAGPPVAELVELTSALILKYPQEMHGPPNKCYLLYGMMLHGLHTPGCTAAGMAPCWYGSMHDFVAQILGFPVHSLCALLFCKYQSQAARHCTASIPPTLRRHEK